MAHSLSERHLSPHYKVSKHAATLRALITSAFRDLSRCIEIINRPAPISRLPSDVVGLIFRAAQAGDVALSQSSQSRPILLRLSEVSQSWHDVAMNSPQLWTTVKIAAPWDLGEVQAYLYASKSLPIDPSIEAWGDDTVGFDENSVSIDPEPLCNILTLHMHRCRSISIVCGFTFWSLILEISTILKDLDEPQLEKFSVLGNDNIDLEGRGPGGEHIQLFSNSISRVSDLRMNIDTFLCVQPPLHGLMTLHLQPGTEIALEFSHFLGVLSQCPVLENLTVYASVVDDSQDTITAECFMPSLRSLRFFNVMEQTSEILLAIEAPLLHDIVFAPCHHEELSVLKDWVRETGQPKFPSMKALGLSIAKTGAHALQIASDCFHEIEDLTLVGKNSALLIRTLAETNNGGLWPHLHKITLRGISDGESEEALRKPLTLRYTIGLPISQIALDTASLTNMSRLEWVKSQARVIECDWWSAFITDSFFAHNPDLLYEWIWRDSRRRLVRSNF